MASAVAERSAPEGRRTLQCRISPISSTFGFVRRTFFATGAKPTTSDFGEFQIDIVAMHTIRDSGTIRNINAEVSPRFDNTVCRALVGGDASNRASINLDNDVRNRSDRPRQNPVR